MKKQAEKVDLKLLNGTKKKTLSLGMSLLMMCLLAIAIVTLLLQGNLDRKQIDSLNAKVQNLTNETAKLTGWAQYFSPAAIQAINDLASNQQNMTGRIITLELKNGITPIELLQNKTK